MGYKQCTAEVRSTRFSYLCEGVRSRDGVVSSYPKILRGPNAEKCSSPQHLSYKE